MTHLASFSARDGEAGRRIAQLHELRQLVGRIAGESGPTDEDRLGAAAAIAAAQDKASGIARRHFEAQASETAAWATAGVEALVAIEPNAKAAAARLAQRIDAALREMRASLEH